MQSSYAAPLLSSPLVGPAPSPFSGFLRTNLLANVNQQPSRPSSTFLSLTPAAAEDLYRGSLSAAASVISHANEDATVRRRLALGRELQEWLQALPAPYPNTLLTARPEELLVYLQSSFTERHAGTHLPGHTSPVASPTGVAGAISHLSTLFESLGRRGPYDPSSGLGNPCNSSEVRRYQKGYSRELWHAGYQESSAVPTTRPKLEAVVTQITGEISLTHSPLQNLCLERDALLLLYSWDSAMRGKEGGSLCLFDLHTADKVQIFPNAFSPNSPLPTVLLVLPTHGTKTNKRGRAHQDPIRIDLQPTGSAFCFITRLWSFMEYSHLHGLTISHYLFRPLDASRSGFKEAAYSSSSLNHMYKGRLSGLGLFSGETPHGLRRGTLQATAADPDGGTLAAALQGRIKTPKILERYLDTHRHLGRLKS